MPDTKILPLSTRVDVIAVNGTALPASKRGSIVGNELAREGCEVYLVKLDKGYDSWRDTVWVTRSEVQVLS